MDYPMKHYERVISFILLFIISLSNIAAPAAYAAELGKFHLKLPAAPQQTNPLSSSSTLPQPDHGSVLGASTSLLTVGSQQLNLSQGNVSSAHKRIPVRMQQLTKKVYQTDEPVTIAVTNPDNESFTTAIKDTSGKSVPVPIIETNNGATTNVQLSPSNAVKPGTYVVTVTDQDGNSTTQDFSWGVLALNFDKSMYHPNQTGDISMAVLNDKGDMVCDAAVKLEVRSEKGEVTELSTDNGKITVNPQCQKHDFSLQPDYEAHYQFRGVGTYQVQLTATTQNGTHTITDSIQVKNDIPFDIQRSSATRIYPPDVYPMKINITAHHDFSGTITETVPQDFIITPATPSAQQTTAGSSTTSYDSMQTMYLNTAQNPANKLAQVLGDSTSQLVMPFHGSYPITQGFGAQMTDPALQAFYSHYGLAGHDGIDFGLPMDTPVYAVDDGNVVWSGPGDYGITIIIQHSWGKSYYGHLSSTAVSLVTHVTKGQLIGYSGESGEATGPHLHFGIRPNNPDMNNGYYGKINPLPYLPLGNSAQSAATLPEGSVSPTVTVSPTITPSSAPLINTKVLGSSTSAVASPSVASISATPIPTYTPTASSDASVPATSAFVNTVATSIATPAANENFSVLNKQIQINEQFSNNSQTEEVKVISWHVTLQKGESTTLGYNYQIPQTSPEFYLVGPLQFYGGSNKVVFQESRQWQIAADDVGVEWFQNSSGPHNWNGYSWQYRKKLTIDHTKVSTGLYQTRPTTTYMDSGGDATKDLSSLTLSPTATSYRTVVDCAFSHTGPCSYDFNEGSPSPNYSDIVTPTGSLASTAGRVSMYLYFNTAITSTDIVEFYKGATFVGNPFALNASSEDVCPGTVTHGTTTFQTGQWYRIAIGYTISGTTTNQFKIYINGALDLTCTNVTLNSTAPNAMRLGLDNNTIVNGEVHIDDIYADNGSDLSDPGDIHMTAKLPIAKGASNDAYAPHGSPAGTACISGVNCSYINERPLSETNYLSTATNTSRENFTIQSASSGDVDISKATILADQAWIDTQITSAGCAGEITNNGTDTSVTFLTSETLFTNYANLTKYPTGNQGVGIQSCSTNTLKLYEAGVVIAYIPATSATYTSVTPYFMDSGGDATGNNLTAAEAFYTNTAVNANGMVSIDSTTSETGPDSWKFSAGTGGSSLQGALVYKNNVVGDSGTRMTGYFDFSTMPSGTDSFWGIAKSNLSGDEFIITVNSSGVLQLFTGGYSNQIGSLGPTLATNKWYRISMSYRVTGATNYSVRVYVNGALAISHDQTSGGTSLGTNINGITMPVGWDSANGSGVVNVDDIYVDNGTDLSDPGDIHVTAKRPLSNGAANQFTPNGSPSGYPSGAVGNAQYVSERPLTTGANVSVSLANQRENYTVESASQGDIDISNAGIIADEAWAYAKSSSNCTGELTNDGVDISIPLVSTGDNMFTNLSSNANFFATNQDVGIQSCTSTQMVNLEESGMQIAYTNNNPANNLTNFPALVSLTDIDLENHAQFNGNDIVFTDSTGQNRLNYEIENYIPSTGALTAWVQIPSLSDATDTIIYMYFGNPSATSLANASGTWDGSYQGVYHMKDNAGNHTVSDSTSYAVTGTASRNTNLLTTSGEIYNALSLTSASFDNITINSGATSIGTESVSFSLWFNPTTTLNSGNSAQVLIDLGDASSTNDVGIENGGGISTSCAAGFLCFSVDNGSVWQSAQTAESSWTSGTWYFVTGTFSPSTGLQMYVNGAEDGSNSSTTRGSTLSTLLWMGAETNSTHNFDGKLDEVRVSNVARAPGWVYTEYQNENAPSSFIQVNNTLETNIYAPTLAQLMKHGQWFDSEGVKQPFTF